MGQEHFDGSSHRLLEIKVHPTNTPEAHNTGAWTAMTSTGAPHSGLRDAEWKTETLQSLANKVPTYAGSITAAAAITIWTTRSRGVPGGDPRTTVAWPWPGSLRGRCHRQASLQWAQGLLPCLPASVTLNHTSVPKAPLRGLH